MGILSKAFFYDLQEKTGISISEKQKVRVERVVTSPLPHRSGRAAFPHPVPQ